MNYYIEELLDYLDIYKILIDKNLYDSSRSKDIEEINSLINTLNNCYNNKHGIDEFDYKEFRRKFLSVFHPDVYKYKIPKEFGVDNQVLIAKINAALDNVAIAKKDGVKYNYNAPQDSYSEEDIFEEEMYNARKEERNEKRKEFKDKVREKSKKALMYMKERINASLFHIPSNEDDYHHIIDTFEKDLRNLDFRKVRTTEALNMLKEEKVVLENMWNGEKDNVLLATKYFKEMKVKENIMVNAKFIYEGAKKKLDSYVDYKYKDKYQQIMTEWKDTSDEILKEYLDEKVRYSNRLNGYIDENDKRETKEIKKNLKRLEREYDQYPKYEAMKKKAIDTLTKNDKSYKELKNDVYKYEQNYRETERQYNYYMKYKDGIINGYKKEIDSEYSGKRFKLNMKIKHYERKLRRINNDIMRNIEAREVFETKYKYNFEEYTGEIASGFQR